MSGTDLDVAVRIKVLADVKEGGSLTAPGKKLQEITRELPDQPVEVATRGDQIELRCGRSHFKLNGLPADEFPTLAEVDFSEGITVTGKNLNGLIHHTSFAVSNEDESSYPERRALGTKGWGDEDGRDQRASSCSYGYQSRSHWHSFC